MPCLPHTHYHSRLPVPTFPLYPLPHGHYRTYHLCFLGDSTSFVFVPAPGFLLPVPCYHHTHPCSYIYHAYHLPLYPHSELLPISVHFLVDYIPHQEGWRFYSFVPPLRIHTCTFPILHTYSIPHTTTPACCLDVRYGPALLLVLISGLHTPPRTDRVFDFPVCCVRSLSDLPLLDLLGCHYHTHMPAHTCIPCHHHHFPHLPQFTTTWVSPALPHSWELLNLCSTMEWRVFLPGLF